MMKPTNKPEIISGSIAHIPDDRIWVHAFDESDAQKFANGVLKVAEKGPLEPIVVWVDSYGGHIDGLATMIGVMDSVPNRFITIASGKAMSAGAILLSHGDIRCVGPHARIMIHEALGGAGGNVNDVMNDAAELGRVSDYFMDVMARNCGRSLKQLKQLWSKQREIYLNASEAVKFGIADHVGIPSIQKQTVYQMNFMPEPTSKKK